MIKNKIWNNKLEIVINSKVYQKQNNTAYVQNIINKQKKNQLYVNCNKNIYILTRLVGPVPQIFIF